MTQEAETMDWTTVAPTPLARLRAIRDYAHLVFDDENLAATWLSRANRAVAGGLCAVGAACQDADGFRDAIAELARLERLERLVAQGFARERTIGPVQRPTA